MVEEKPGHRLSMTTGLIGLVTAALGLVGTGVAIWSQNKGDDDVRPIAAAAAEVGTPGIDQSGLENAPPMVDGYMSGPAVVDFIAANNLCYEPDPDGACIVSAELDQRSPRAVRWRETFFSRLPAAAIDTLDLAVADDFARRRLRRPDGVARVDLVDYAITREGLCVTRDTRTAGAARTHVFGVEDGGALIPLSSEGLDTYRERLRETWAGEAVGEVQCWRFRMEDGRLRQYYFIDGALQPNNVVYFTVQPSDSRPMLRLP